jgi:hypothetical protein
MARENRDATMHEEVFEIVRELRKQNIYPSLQRAVGAQPGP